MQTVDWSGVRAMVFDMDGTLLNTEQVIVSSASQVLEHLGHAPLPAGYAMPNMFGTDGVWMCMPIADALSVLLASVLVYNQVKDFKKKNLC